MGNTRQIVHQDVDADQTTLRKSGCRVNQAVTLHSPVHPDSNVSVTLSLAIESWKIEREQRIFGGARHGTFVDWGEDYLTTTFYPSKDACAMSASQHRATRHKGARLRLRRRCSRIEYV